MMPLYHFSEDPHIARFEPRIAPSSALKESVVWAISDWYQVTYFFPRDCPRACFWPGEHTTDADMALMSETAARMVIAVEAAWLDRIRTTTLYRYTMPAGTFRLREEGGRVYTSDDAVVPLKVEPMDDLLKAIADADVELRVTPSLVELWRRVIGSTLEFSGTRLRNAAGWDSVDWDAVPLGPAAKC
jgi:hypothetical protein